MLPGSFGLMPESPRYLVHHGGAGETREAGAIFDLPRHGQVCLHSDDPDLVILLESAGLIVPVRPPYLDAAESGVHGAYRPRPQVNIFLEPPVEGVAEAFAGAFEATGSTYRIEPAAPSA